MGDITAASTTKRHMMIGSTSFNLIAIGILFFAHQHNPEAIAVRYHKVMGILIFSLGLSHLSGTRNKYACVYMWIVNGLWLLHMSLFMYASGSTIGLHVSFAGDSYDPNETICFY